MSGRPAAAATACVIADRDVDPERLREERADREDEEGVRPGRGRPARVRLAVAGRRAADPGDDRAAPGRCRADELEHPDPLVRA